MQRRLLIVAVGLASLLLFFVASAITVTYLRREVTSLNPAAPMLPAQAGQRKIGIVEQQLFENANRARAGLRLTARAVSPRVRITRLRVTSDRARSGLYWLSRASTVIFSSNVAARSISPS